MVNYFKMTGNIISGIVNINKIHTVKALYISTLDSHTKVPNKGYAAVSYTHLTLPTTPYV